MRSLIKVTVSSFIMLMLFIQANPANAGIMDSAMQRLANSNPRIKEANDIQAVNLNLKFCNSMPTYKDAEKMYLATFDQAKKDLGDLCKAPELLIEMSVFYIEYDKINESNEYITLLRKCPKDSVASARGLMRIANLKKVKGQQVQQDLLDEIYERYKLSIASLEDNIEHPKIYGKGGGNMPDFILKQMNEKMAEQMKNDKSNPLNAEVAQNMTTVAEMYVDLGNYKKAEEYYEKAVDIQKAIYSQDDEGSGFHEAMGTFSAIGAVVKKGQNESPKTRALNGLAYVYFKMGQKEKFEKLYSEDFTAINSRNSMKGNVMKFSGDPQNINLLSSFGRIHAGFGEYEQANKDLSESMKLMNEIVFNAVSVLGMGDDYLADIMRNQKKSIDAAVANAIQGNLGNNAFGEIYGFWINNKCYMADLQRNVGKAIEKSGSSGLSKKYRKLLSVQREIALLSGNTEKENKRKSELQMEKLELDTEIKRSLGSKKIPVGSIISLSDIAPAITSGTTLIDIIRYFDYDFKNQCYTNNKYAAFIIKGGEQSVRLVSLGDADIIDNKVKAYLNEIKSKVLLGNIPDVTKLMTVGADLYALVFEPLAATANGDLVISTDGMLNLIPFETFVDRNGKFVGESENIKYLSSCRDLSRKRIETTSKEAAIFANPDFGKQVKPSSKDDEINPVLLSIRESNMLPLPETAKEAAEAQTSLSSGGIKANLFEGKEASEDALMKINKPAVLHIATHGYFVKDSRERENRDSGLVFGGFNVRYGTWVDPMMRSGIVLAGVNDSLSKGKVNGIVTAGDISTLDLNGTSLVVLSACSTGIGDIESGQGVFGLQRAVMGAGAESLIVSFWPVPSAETAKLMSLFYGKWKGQGSPAKALKDARTQILKENPNPFYWGAFTIIGSN